MICPFLGKGCLCLSSFLHQWQLELLELAVASFIFGIVRLDGYDSRTMAMICFTGEV